MADYQRESIPELSFDVKEKRMQVGNETFGKDAKHVPSIYPGSFSDDNPFAASR